MSSSPKISFKILGWVTMIAQWWHDIMCIKRWKKTQQARNCHHQHNFCECAIQFIMEQTNYDRPFDINLQLESENNCFCHVSPNTETLLKNVGLKIATILCTDISKEPALPHIFGSFAISKIYFNKMWAYILSGQKLRWNYHIQPTNHVI